MPDEDQRSRNPQVRVVVSKDAIADRLAQLPTRKEMYRAVLLGGLVSRPAPAIGDLQPTWL
jgi:hypothetical protein